MSHRECQKIAVRPPEYFPRPEFFALMMAVDVFVLADTFQYSRQSYQNRTRVRTPDGWVWLSIPLQGGQHGRPICKVRTDRRRSRWMSKHWRTLEYNYRSSPFFAFYENTIGRALEVAGSHLSDVTVASVRALREVFEIETPLLIASELEPPAGGAMEAAGALGDGGLVILPETATVDRQASYVLDWVAPAYPQNFPGFEGGMSAMDMLFNIGPEARRLLARSSIRVL